MTEEEIKRHKADIDKLSREEMCRLHRFAPSGHVYFITGNGVTEYFGERFQELGVFSPGISKSIGWGD